MQQLASKIELIDQNSKHEAILFEQKTSYCTREQKDPATTRREIVCLR